MEALLRKDWCPESLQYFYKVVYFKFLLKIIHDNTSAMSKNLMVSLVPLLYVPQLTFSSLYYTPSGLLASNGLLWG